MQKIRLKIGFVGSAIEKEKVLFELSHEHLKNKGLFEKEKERK